MIQVGVHLVETLLYSAQSLTDVVVSVGRVFRCGDQAVQRLHCRQQSEIVFVDDVQSLDVHNVGIDETAEAGAGVASPLYQPVDLVGQVIQSGHLGQIAAAQENLTHILKVSLLLGQSLGHEFSMSLVGFPTVFSVAVPGISGNLPHLDVRPCGGL